MEPGMVAPVPSSSPQEEDVRGPEVTGCWCCGEACMFCEPDGYDCGGPHWCPECKFTGCDWCCGCPDCRKKNRGGWSPAGTQVRHGSTETREAPRDPAIRRT